MDPIPNRASCRPPPALAPYIDRFWFWSAPAGSELPLLLPGTGAECFFLLGPPLFVRLGSKNILPTPTAFLLCNRRQTLQLTAPQATQFIAVRFRAGQLRHFIPGGFTDVQDQLTAATALWPAAAQLEEQLRDLAAFTDQAQKLGGFLLRQQHQRHSDTLDTLLNRLYYQPNTRIEALAAAAGWSRRNLDQRFLALYGQTPKHFARIARLQQVVRQLALQPQQRLLDLALDGGYFDQAHFGHDLSKLTNLTPTALRIALQQRSHFYHPLNPSQSESLRSRSFFAAPAY